ncbi:MAG: hypothetical protein ABSH35_04580 [Isosphaeraceae bacterium]|jgi:hypothetical protein
MTVILIRSRALVLSVVMLSLGLVAGCESETSTTPPPPPIGTPPPAAAVAKKDNTAKRVAPISDASKDTARGYRPPK